MYLLDVEGGESPEAYMRIEWLKHHRYLLPVGRCVHGKIDPHSYWGVDDNPPWETEYMCPGSPTLVGDDS